MSTNVRVICRFRPVNAREAQEYAGKAQTMRLEFPNEQTVDVYLQGQAKQPFTFDRVFPPTSMQQDIYELAAQQTIVDVTTGFNGTIFAYGQTGSGKTHTMLGELKDANLRGIIPRAAAHIFQLISEDQSGGEWTIKCSYLEIYKEQINDLFESSKKNLKVHESPTKGVYVQDLTEEFISKEEDITDLLELGGKVRAVSATAMNAGSSRSHSVFTLYVNQKAADGTTKTGKLNLVDLAGSEKVAKTGAQGETLEEAKKINQSLSALGNCIHALTERGRGHVPFRDSKLTRILQESLGGNCKTTLLCACSPHEFNIEETISTLKFAQRAKTIKTVARVNAQKSAAELQRIVDALKRELAELRRYAEGLEKTIEWMKSGEYQPGKVPPFAVAKRPAAMADGAVEGADGETAEGRPATTAAESEVPMSPGSPGSLGSPVFAMSSVGISEQLVELEALKVQQQNKIDALKEELEEAKDNFSQKEGEFEQMEEKVAAAEAKANEAQLALETERQQWTAAKQKMEFAFNEQQLDLNTAMDEVESMQKQLDDLSARVSNAEADRDKAQAELQKALREMSKVSEAEVQSLKVAAEEAAAKLVSAQQRLRDTETELAKIKSKSDELELENEDLHEFVAQVEAEKEQVVAEVAAVQTQLKLKEQQVTALESSLKAAKAAAHEFEAQVSAVEAQKETVTGRLEADVKKQRQAVKDAETRIRSLTEQVARLEAERAVHDEAIMRVKTANADLEQTIAALQKSNAALRTKGADDGGIGDLARERDEMVERLTEQLKAAAADRQREVTQLNQKYDSMNQTLSAELRKAQQQRDELQLQVEGDVAALKASTKRAEELASAAKRRAEAAEQELEAARAECAKAVTKEQETTMALDRLTMEKNQLEAKVMSEEQRLQVAAKKYEDLEKELTAVRSSYDEAKLTIEELQRKINRGFAPAQSGASSEQVRQLESELSTLRSTVLETETELRKQRELAERAKTEADREAARAKGLTKRIEQQSEHLATVEEQLREALANQKKLREDAEKAVKAAATAAAERDKAEAENQELRHENETLAARAIRSGRLIKPLTAKTVSTPFTERIEFGTHMLRQTNSKLLEQVRQEAARAAVPSSPVQSPK